MSSTINWTISKQRILAMAASTRAHKFTRVSGQVKHRLEVAVENEIAKIVREQPSCGKTIS